MLILELFAAAQGDGLLLRHGTEAAPRFMLIDGGAGGTWVDALEPRLKELGAGDPFGHALRLELIMVSHLDDDHINGIVGLVTSQVDLEDEKQPVTIKSEALWVNVFDELTGSTESETGSVSSAAADSIGASMTAASGPESSAVIASIPQGRRLRDLARRLKIPLNNPFHSGLVSSGDVPDRVTFGEIEVQILGPSQKRLQDLRKKWTDYLKAHQAKDKDAIAKSAAYVDRSVYNLSSIIAMVRQGSKQVLFTGDARGDDIISGLTEANLLRNGKIHVDVLKVPHHGSARNVTEEFFRQVTANHYVICSDGTDDNPDQKMLEMLRAARKGKDYHLWFSYRLDRLDKFVADSHRAGEIFKASFRKDEDPSLIVDFG
jgi:beta-lactamase superfamily II metal-dependent hydrolase